MTENIFLAPQASPAQLGLNINDIIEVIREDKEYTEADMSIYGHGGTPSETCSVISSISRNDPDIEQKRKAYVQIVEQPQAKALRFRYICEGRSAGSIPGVRSTAENKTYPTIKIVGYKGPAVVVVSCVTVDPPYRPHPHNLVGKEGCSKGVCTITIDNDSMECIFSNLGIQCVKKKDVEQALKLREEIRVDPFGTGFSHRNQPQSIDLNAVRLCFQVFLSNEKNGKFTFPLKPVVSDSIYDKKATSDLNICKLSECTSCVTGGKEIILLCDKVTKEDIQIRFFEIKDGRIEWEAYGDFLASDVHKQVAISFKTPKYKNLEVQHPVNCYIQLQRPSDKATSEPRPFEYLPMDAGRPFQTFKRLKNNLGLFHRILGLDTPVAMAEENLPHKEVNQPSTRRLPVQPSNVGSTQPCIKPSPVQPSIQPVHSLFGGNKLSQVNSLPSTSHSDIRMTEPNKSICTTNQSLDDIKQRMVANMDKRKGVVSPPILNQQVKKSPLWLEDTSLYSDTDILDEVLSQGSVNDILSTVGDGIAVYEDVDALMQPTEITQDAIDALYGDTSYASCYSNLEFVIERAKSASSGQHDLNCNFMSTPLLPPKRLHKNSLEDRLSDESCQIYGTPSGRPIHPNKEALLKERGFFVANTSDDQNKIDMENNVYSPVSDIIELEEESEINSKEIGIGDIPQTILDLFV